MVSWTLVNIGPGNGLVPSGTKPLPEPGLIRDYWHPSQWGRYVFKTYHVVIIFPNNFMHLSEHSD